MKKRLSFLLLLLALLLTGCGHGEAESRKVDSNAEALDLRDGGLSSLELLEDCSRLRSADLRGNALSVEEIRAFSEAHPACALRWDIPLGEERYDSASESLHLSALPEDRENLFLFPALKTLTLECCEDADFAEALRSAGITLFYSVRLGEESVPSTARELAPKDCTAEELRTALPLLPELETLELHGCKLTQQEKNELAALCPGVKLLCSVELGQRSLESGEKNLSFWDHPVSYGELSAALPLFYELETAEVSDCGYSSEELHSLCEDFPDTEFYWSYSLFGNVYSSESREIDLSGIKMESSEAVEAALPYFPKLEKVIMCNCGLDDETMDALNKKYESIRFVWMVTVYNKGVRTDRDYFIIYNADESYSVGVDHPNNLRYCTDLVAVDLGHFWIDNDDLEWCYYTPHLRYFVAVKSLLTDITPLGACQELEYLELYTSPIESIAPLAECKNLKHLNISRCFYLKEDCIDVLCGMKSLERLWFLGNFLSEEEGEKLSLALPDTEIHFFPFQGAYAPGVNSSGWKKHPAYYAMRDALHMYYMDDEE